MIEILVGTNRRNSNSSVLAKWLLQYYHNIGADAQIMDLVELPLETFSPDAYREKPEAVLEFTERIVKSSGLVIVTPEYNGSMPGALKLFIDHLPFPESFENRPICLFATSSKPTKSRTRKASCSASALVMPNSRANVETNSRAVIQSYIFSCSGTKPIREIGRAHV
mgnify:CR=1 FL=1